MKKLTEKFNSISVAAGEVFEIVLDAIPQTGQYWEASVTEGKAELLASHLKPMEANSWWAGFAAMGGCMTHSFKFRAAEAGEVRIEAHIKNPMTQTSDSAPTVFKVKVQ